MKQPNLTDLFTVDVRPLPQASPQGEERQRLNAAALRVLDYLKARRGEWVTNVTLASPEIGGLRFGGRLKELRDDGWQIETQTPAAGGTYRYRLTGLR